MSKIIKEIQEKIHGDIAVDPKSREYFSTDGSIFKVTP